MLRKPVPVILIVDDSAIVLDRMVQMLKEVGITHNVIYADSYQQALNQLEQQRPDLAFFDINLADGNGIDLLREVRKRYPLTKSIMFTNHCNEYYKNLCISLGAISFLDKSLDFDRIPEYISTLTPYKAA